jgi:HK97 family phage portal protein
VSKQTFTVEYDSGIDRAERTMTHERKAVATSRPMPLVASRQDGDNFRTNMVTLAEYQDGIANAGNVMGLAAAWACVRLISGTISSLPLMVYRNAGDSREVAYDHPLYRILHDSPNADQTALNFWQFMSAAIELHGNAYAEIERGAGGRVIALNTPIAPEFVEPRRLANGAIEYRLHGRNDPRPQDRMLHIRGFGGNPLGGLSTLAYGRQTFGMAMAIERAAQATFRNGVNPSGAVSTDKPLTGPQHKALKEDLAEGFMGATQFGKPMVLDNGLKWQQLTINPDDAQMLESRAFSVEEICRFFSTPPHMIGHTEKSTSWGTGIEQMTIGFVQFTLRERLKNIESTLEKQLLSPVERQQGIRIEFNIEGLLRGDSKTRSEVHASALLNGWRTINEVRAIENLPPVPGGDVPRMQMQNVPITEAGKQPPGVAA